LIYVIVKQISQITSCR